MIFVSMDSSDLLARTSQYHLRDPSDSEDLIIFSDDVDENRPLSRRRDPDSPRTVPPPISNSIPRSVRHNANTTSTTFSRNPYPHDLGPNSTPDPHTPTPQETAGFNVTTTCDSPSSDEEEPSSAATLADLYRRDHLPPAYDMSSDEEFEDHERAMRRARQLGIPTSNHGHRRSRRRAKPSRVEVVMHNSETEAKDILPPHARFFIQREKSVVSVKFDPPV